MAGIIRACVSVASPMISSIQILPPSRRPVLKNIEDLELT